MFQPPASHSGLLLASQAREVEALMAATHLAAICVQPEHINEFLDKLAGPFSAGLSQLTGVMKLQQLWRVPCMLGANPLADGKGHGPVPGHPERGYTSSG
jgi:hypothetical protein